MIIVWANTDKLLKKYAEISTHAGDLGPDPDECCADWYWASEKVRRDFENLRDNILSDLYHNGVWVGHYWELVTIDERGWFHLWRNMEELLDYAGHESFIYLDDDGKFCVEMKGRTPSKLIAQKFDGDIWRELSEPYRKLCWADEKGHLWSDYDGPRSAVKNFWKKLVPKEIVLKSLKPIGADIERRLSRH